MHALLHKLHLRTLPARALFLVLVVRTTPPSVGSSETVLAFARPLYFHAFLLATLLGSVVNSAPRLPIPLRPDCLFLMIKLEVSRTMPHTRSGETFAMLQKLQERTRPGGEGLSETAWH